MQEYRNWQEGMAEAYSDGLEDGKAGKESREPEYAFRRAYREGYMHGYDQYLETTGRKEAW